MPVYVVIGTTGEYSDHREWPVKAYYSKTLAEQHVVNAGRRANELFVQYGRYGDVPKGENEYDSKMESAYTGQRYYIWEVELDATP